MIQWSERTVTVDELKPYERNPRKITDDQYRKLVASLRGNGYHQRILATSDLRVIGGHQRIRAMKELGFTTIVILVPDQDIPDDQFRQLLISDNLPFGTFDWEMMGEDFTSAELSDWGMPADWLKSMPKKFDDDKADEVPPAQSVVITKPGDIWLLGTHRLLCGDSTVPENVDSLLAGAKPNLMITDPPYGVNYDANWRNEADRANGKPYGARAIGAVMNDDRADWSDAYKLFPGNIAYVWHPAGATSIVFYHSIASAGFKIRMQIIWAKNHFPIGRGDYHVQHEPCWYAIREKGNWCGDRKQTTVWNIDKPQKSETGHSTQKPVECMRRPIVNNSAPGDAVYDPFMGSGTTIIAAEQTDRRAFGIEISPAYCDVICRRYAAFCEKPVIRESDGITFAKAASA